MVAEDWSGGALLADDELFVAVGDSAVAEALARRATADADADSLIPIGKLFRHSIVEHVERSQKILPRVLLHVGADAAVELIHIFEPLLLQISRSFFTPHAVRTYGEHLLSFEMLEFRHDGFQVAEVAHAWVDAAGKMPNREFVVVPHVHNGKVVTVFDPRF